MFIDLYEFDIIPKLIHNFDLCVMFIARNVKNYLKEGKIYIPIYYLSKYDSETYAPIVFQMLFLNIAASQNICIQKTFLRYVIL